MADCKICGTKYNKRVAVNTLGDYWCPKCCDFFQEDGSQTDWAKASREKAEAARC